MGESKKKIIEKGSRSHTKAENDLTQCLENQNHFYIKMNEKCTWCKRTQFLQGYDPFPFPTPSIPNFDFLENPESRCPCIFLLDVSSSMHGIFIQELNLALQEFQAKILQDEVASKRLEVAIITFGDRVRVIQDFVTADQLIIPELTAWGPRPMGAAIHKALEILIDRKNTYKVNGIPYFRPWIFLLTNGVSTDEWASAAKRIQKEERKQGIVFISASVGNQGDLDFLSKIAVRQPVMLKNLDFSRAFAWLSSSITTTDKSESEDNISLQSPFGWGEV